MKRISSFALYGLLATSGSAALGCIFALTVDAVRPFIPLVAFVATCQRVSSVPLELFIFIAADAARRTWAAPLRLGGAIVVAGLSIALVHNAPARCVGAWFTGACSLCLLIVSCLSIRTEGSATLAEFRSQLRRMLTEPTARRGLLAFLFGYAAVALLLHIEVEAVGARKALDAEARTWYNAGRALSPSPARTPLAVELFVDYQCPACRSSVPMVADVVARARWSSLSVQMVARNFPLDSRCNAFVPAGRSLHPAACDAAAAALLVRRANPAQGAAFEGWLLGNQSHLTPDLIRAHLAGMQLDGAFATQYEDLMRLVVADIERGHRLGVAGTPALVVNGVRLDNIVTAERLQKLIGFESARGLRGSRPEPQLRPGA